MLAQAHGRDPGWLEERSGVYHAVAAGSCTWHELAAEILRLAPPAGGPVTIEPVSTAAYGARAARPARTVLDCGALASAFGLRLPHWGEHVRSVLEDRLAGAERPRDGGER